MDMNIYRIKITMPDGSKGTAHGIFTDGCEAVVQVLADFPEAVRIAVFFVMKGGAA
ncbi:hypothetical protein [Limnohabitans sp.]|uniref:hypothetical protein n=1 Tax=Limnohabitans sp. TaxID=1907725 RepID=UPI00286ED3E8|nr:hypothetical protein [Limnohabitans sp.]